MNLEILHRDSLPLGGFAGLKEHRLVVAHKAGGDKNTWNGIGDFIYLADARFSPNGETKLHPHKEIDVISIMVEGRITHEGSMEHGKSMLANQVQVQRAGAEGFKHNEINPDPTPNRMIQIWVQPEISGESASYKFYELETGKLTVIYGGSQEQTETFSSKTIIEVGLLNKAQEISKQGPFMAYITKGSGILNGKTVTDGDLIRGLDLNFKTTQDAVQIIIITA